MKLISQHKPFSWELPELQNPDWEKLVVQILRKVAPNGVTLSLNDLDSLGDPPRATVEVSRTVNEVHVRLVPLRKEGGVE